MEIGERIVAIRNRKDIQQQELASMIQLDPAVLNRIEKGKRPIRVDELENIADALGVSISVLTGKEEEEHPKKGVNIPVLGYVAAGFPMYAAENIIDWEEISVEMSRRGEHFWLVIHGDSMESTLHEGDVIIVRKQSDIDDGQIGIFLIENESATCKQLKRQANGIMLVSFNSAKYPPLLYTEEDIKGKPVICLGKVVEMRRKFA